MLSHILIPKRVRSWKHQTDQLWRLMKVYDASPKLVSTTAVLICSLYRGSRSAKRSDWDTTSMVVELPLRSGRNTGDNVRFGMAQNCPKHHCHRPVWLDQKRSGYRTSTGVFLSSCQNETPLAFLTGGPSQNTCAVSLDDLQSSRVNSQTPVIFLYFTSGDILTLRLISSQIPFPTPWVAVGLWAARGRLPRRRPARSLLPLEHRNYRKMRSKTWTSTIERGTTCMTHSADTTNTNKEDHDQGGVLWWRVEYVHVVCAVWCGMFAVGVVCSMSEGVGDVVWCGVCVERCVCVQYVGGEVCCAPRKAET